MDLIDATPNFENYVLMGDALMNIHEPEDAVNAYQEALKIKADDDAIVRKIGAALT